MKMKMLMMAAMIWTDSWTMKQMKPPTLDVTLFKETWNRYRLDYAGRIDPREARMSK
jgi:hypothetical protein